MIVFVVAIFSEAKALIEYFNLLPIEKKPFLIYQNSDIALIISGIGKIESAVASTHILSKFKECKKIINFGVCGSNYKKIGSLCQIKNIIDKDSDKKYILNSGDETIWCFSKPLEKIKNRKPVLVDMESSGFFVAVKNFVNKDNIFIFKVVSDHLDTITPTKDFIYSITKKHTEKIIESISNRS